MCLISDPLCFERLLAPETIQDSVEVRHFYYKKVHLAAHKIMNCDWNWYVSKKSFRYGKSAFLIKKKNKTTAFHRNISARSNKSFCDQKSEILFVSQNYDNQDANPQS